MATPPMNGDAPVTRDEFGMWIHAVAQQHERLVGAIADLRQEMKAGHETWRQEVKASHEALFVEIGRAVKASHEALFVEIGRVVKSSHDALFVEIGRAARVAAEEHRRELGVLDDRYRDLPPRVSMLERTLDAHSQDAALHAPRSGRPRRRPPRR